MHQANIMDTISSSFKVISVPSPVSLLLIKPVAR